MIYLGFIATLKGRVEEASEVLLESLAYQDREGDVHSIAQLLFVFGLLAGQLGDGETEGTCFSTAVGLQQELKVALPLYLLSAVEQAKQSQESPGNSFAKQAMPWQACVGAILSEPQDWLQGFRRAIL